MNILYVTPYVPSRIRTRPYHLIRALTRLGHQLTLLTAASTTSGDLEQVRELGAWGVKVEAFPVSFLRSLRNCLLALPTREPLQAIYAYHPQVEQRLVELLQERDFDVVHIEHLRAARMVRAAHAVPAVYDSVDCISLLFDQTIRNGAEVRSRLMAAIDLGRTRRYEPWLLTRYDRVTVTSQRDREALEGLARRYLSPQARPAPITVITNGVDLEYFSPQRNVVAGEEPAVVFTGKMSYHANVAAALYFARKVLPLIWSQDPAVRFQIVGKDPPKTIRQLAKDPRIQVTGFVDDLRPYLAGARVAVCPARYAVGVQNKVLEAMAMGTPVVSTSAGCAALAAETEKDLLIADGEEQLADAVVRVLSDPALAQQLSVSGRRYVERHHSWASSAQKLAEVYQEAGSSQPVGNK